MVVMEIEIARPATSPYDDSRIASKLILRTADLHNVRSMAHQIFWTVYRPIGRGTDLSQLRLRGFKRLRFDQSAV